MRVVLQQRLERAEAGHLVEDFGDEGVQFLGIQREPFVDDILADQLLDMLAHLVFRQLFKRLQIDLFQQAAMQAHLGVEQLVGMQRIDRRGGSPRQARCGLRLRKDGPRNPVGRRRQVLVRNRRGLRAAGVRLAVKRPAMDALSGLCFRAPVSVRRRG